MKSRIFSLLVLSTCVSPAFAQTMTRFNEPKQRANENGQIRVTSQSKTDFWRITHYGYITDNGHFYYPERSDNFTATVKVRGGYKDLYDQAGLMVRINASNWIKTGVELVNGQQNISTVFTRDYSDWSVLPKTSSNEFVWFQMIRKDDYVEVKYSTDGKTFQTVREGYFPPKAKCQVGIMAAAPEGQGFEAVFEDFEVVSNK